MHFTIILFLINLFIQNTLENNTCSSNYFCDDCEYCGTSTNNFTSCFYYNMVCKYSYYKLTYSSFMKNSLINYYKTFSDLTTFCGKNDIKFGNNNDEIIIFNSKNKTFPKDKYAHCHYSINIGNITQRKLYLNVDLLKNSNSKEPRNLEFNSIFIFKTLDGKEDAVSINQENVKSKNTYDVYLNEENEVEIFLDFLELNYNDPEEILEIKLINFQKKSSSSSSSGDGETIGGIIGGIAGGIIIFAIIYYCCCKNKTETSTTNTTSGTVKVVPALIPIKN